MVTQLCPRILCVIKNITNMRRLFDHQHPDSSTNSDRKVYKSSKMCKKDNLHITFSIFSPIRKHQVHSKMVHC